MQQNNTMCDETLMMNTSISPSMYAPCHCKRIPSILSFQVRDENTLLMDKHDCNHEIHRYTAHSFMSISHSVKKRMNFQSNYNFISTIMYTVCAYMYIYIYSKIIDISDSQFHIFCSFRTHILALKSSHRPLWQIVQ